MSRKGPPGDRILVTTSGRRLLLDGPRSCVTQQRRSVRRSAPPGWTLVSEPSRLPLRGGVGEVLRGRRGAAQGVRRQGRARVLVPQFLHGRARVVPSSRAFRPQDPAVIHSVAHDLWTTGPDRKVGQDWEDPVMRHTSPAVRLAAAIAVLETCGCWPSRSRRLSAPPPPAPPPVPLPRPVRPRNRARTGRRSRAGRRPGRGRVGRRRGPCPAARPTGADVNAQDDTQQSAYLIATSEGFLDLLELTLASAPTSAPTTALTAPD